MADRVQFQKITGFPRGTLSAMLADAYSFDPRCAESWGNDWNTFDDFFFDHPQIAEQYGFVTVADGEAVGFVTWDPRHRPEYEEIGHNCVQSKFKRQGYGTLQMKEAIRRISLDKPRKIIVTTSALMIPAQNMYERAGFRKTGESPSSHFSGALLHYACCCETGTSRETFRPGGLQSPDYEEIRDFLLRLASPLFTFARWDWMITHPLLEHQFLGKIGLWRNPAREICAAALFDCQPGETYLLALPEYQNILFPEMIEYAVRNLNQGSHFSLVVEKRNHELQHAASQAGFVKSGDTEAVAMFDSQLTSTDYALPDGFTITDMEETPEAGKFARAICRGFEDACLPELTAEFEALAQAGLNRSHVDRTLKIAVLAPDGTMVCTCGLWHDARSRFAVVEPLATVPEFRKLGLARAAVYEGIRRVSARGTTQVLVGSDQPFYYKIGFSPLLTAEKWEKDED